mgnify:CR=1 FL=1
MKLSIIKSYAKINLSLNIIKKLTSNLHKIESLVSFIDLYDLIYLRQIKSTKHKVLFSGKFSKGINRKNTITKLLAILDHKKFLQKKNLKLKLLKIFPKNLEWVEAR